MFNGTTYQLEKDDLLAYPLNKVLYKPMLLTLSLNNYNLFSLIVPFYQSNTLRYCVEMATFGVSAAQFFMVLMIVGMFCVTNTVAQDSEIAPTSQLETGAGFALPVSGVTLCSSVLASIVAFMMQ